ncbi:MAG TPA: sigma-70 family RNA polymerase sigma factor [Acidimicrobiales bacterium]
MMSPIAVEQTFEFAYPRLVAVATTRAARILGSADDAEDVAQEALLKAHGAWPSIAPYAEAWVSRVSTNAALSRLRRRTPSLDDRRAAIDDTGPVAQRVDVLRALEALPARQREAVVLRHVLDLGERDTAAAMGCSPGAVKRHLHRAMATLRDAPALAAIRDHVLDKHGENLVSVWQHEHARAVEPTKGGPPRPWDHRSLLGADGRRFDRIAVDETGAPIVDADGDEVLTGPGFDFVPVKHVVLDAVDVPHTEIDWSRLADETRAAGGRAHDWANWHGHTWVGEEHLCLALLELAPATAAHVPFAGEVDHAWFNRVVAGFYEGPYANRRVAIVDERRASSWSPSRSEGEEPPHLNWSASAVLEGATQRAAAADLLATPDDLMRALVDPSRDHALVLRWCQRVDPGMGHHQGE